MVVEEEGRARRARRVPRVESELVEVVLGRLDLAVVADLVAEAEEGVLDLAPRLRDRVQVPERERVAGEGDVDDLLGERTVELRALELCAASLERALEPVADAVQRHPALAIADLAESLRELALAAEVADARLLELGGGRGACDRALCLGFQGLGIHPPTVPSASVSAYEPFAAIYDDWASHMTEDVQFYVELAREADGPVVELAVGNGRVAIPVSQAIGPMLGIDLSPAMLAQARERATEAGVPLELQEGDMRELSLEEPAALIYCPFRGLLHLPTWADRRQVFERVAASLAAGRPVRLERVRVQPAHRRGERRHLGRPGRDPAPGGSRAGRTTASTSRSRPAARSRSGGSRAPSGKG